MSNPDSDKNNEKGKVMHTKYDDEGNVASREEYREQREPEAPAKSSHGRLSAIKDKLRAATIPKKLPREERIRRIKEDIEETTLKVNLANQKARLAKHNQNRVSRIMGELGSIAGPQPRSGKTGQNRGRRAADRPAPIFEMNQDFLTGNGASMEMGMSAEEFFFGGKPSKKKKGKPAAGISPKEFYGF